MADKGTVAWCIQRVIEDRRDNANLKQFGRTHLGILRMLQSAPIGQKQAYKLTKQDIIEHVKARRRTVSAATVAHDVTFLRRALEDYGATWEDYDVSAAALAAARPYLRKNQLVGKSQPRKRRPTDEEVAALLEAARTRDAHPRAQIRLADCFAFALASSRRRGEICRITHGDVDYENRVYWVRDVKHTTRKRGNDKKFALLPELEAIIRRQPRAGADPRERIFPFNDNSLGAAFVEIKRQLGIENLRFHDSRRDCISRWLLKPGIGPQDVRLLLSGHDSVTILEKNYDGRDALEVAKAKLPEFQVPTA